MVRVRPLAHSCAKVLYSTSGVAVHASPYHASGIRLQESKLTIKTPRGASVQSIIRQIGMVDIESRADGQEFFVRKMQEGIDRFDQNLSPQGRVGIRDLSLFAPAAGLFWGKSKGEQFAIFESGEWYTVRGPAGETSLAFVLLGGQAVVKVEGPVDTASSSQMASRMAATRLRPSKVIVDGRSFYWTIEPDGAIAGYLVG